MSYCIHTTTFPSSKYILSLIIKQRSLQRQRRSLNEPITIYYMKSPTTRSNFYHTYSCMNNQSNTNTIDSIKMNDHTKELKTKTIIIHGTIPKMGIGLELNQYCEMDHHYTMNDILLYTKLIGDSNPIHQIQQIQNYDHNNHDDTVPVNNHHHPNNNNNVIIVPGMFVGSIFSAMIGTLIPGAIYKHQTLHFYHPVSIKYSVFPNTNNHNHNNNTDHLNSSTTSVTGRIVITKLRPISRKHGILMICETIAYQTKNNNDKDGNHKSESTGTTLTTPITADSSSTTTITPSLNINDETKNESTIHKEHDQNDVRINNIENSKNIFTIIIRGQASVWVPNGTLKQVE